VTVRFQKFTITARTATGQLSYSVCDFQPKLVILWGTKQSTSAQGDGNFWSFGAAGLSTDTASNFGYSCHHGSLDAAAATDTRQNYANTLYAQAANTSAGTNAAAMDGAADFVAFTSDGFTLDWWDAASAAWIIHGIVIGGDDIVDTWVGGFAGAAATGSADHTDASVGFTPDAAIFFGPGTVNASLDTSVADRAFFIGAAVSSSKEWVHADAAPDGDTNGACQRRFHSTTKCLAMFDGGTTAVSQNEADFTQFLADGFRLNWSAVGDTTTVFAAILIDTVSGSTIDVGTLVAPTSPGTVSPTTIHRPEGVLFAATGGATEDTDANEAHLSIGSGADDGSLVEGMTWYGDDTVDPTDVKMQNSTTKVIQCRTDQATVTKEADFTATADTSFTVDFTTADATAGVDIGWMSFGAPVAGGGDVFIENLHPIMAGMKAVSAAGMDGVLVT
jgi:hypothetical protein